MPVPALPAPMRALALLMLALGPGAALAQDQANAPQIALTCRFDTACVEADPCAASGHEMRVTGTVGGLGAGVVLARATLSSESGDVEAFGTVGGGTLFLQGGDNAAHHYLVATGTDARYTVHRAAGPRTTSYIGTCE